MTEAAPALQSLHMVRRFAASPARVFDAWTVPDLAARWLFTGPDSESHRTEIDLKVGGLWEIVDRRGGVDYRAVGEYLEIEPPRRLVFSFGMPQFSDAFTTVTVEIEADGDGARMTLTQAGLQAEAVAALEQGWRHMCDGLARQLAGA
jgi:uncharacterized protein YndB with AHSA1/START domain